MGVHLGDEFQRVAIQVHIQPRQLVTVDYGAHAIWRSQSPLPRDDELDELAATPGLADGWKKRLRDRVEWLRKQPS